MNIAEKRTNCAEAELSTDEVRLSTKSHMDKGLPRLVDLTFSRYPGIFTKEEQVKIKAQAAKNWIFNIAFPQMEADAACGFLNIVTKSYLKVMYMAEEIGYKFTEEEKQRIYSISNTVCDEFVNIQKKLINSMLLSEDKFFGDIYDLLNNINDIYKFTTDKKYEDIYKELLKLTLDSELSTIEKKIKAGTRFHCSIRNLKNKLTILNGFISPENYAEFIERIENISGEKTKKMRVV